MIIRKIQSENSKKSTHEVVILGTTDDLGYPHFSLLSFLDLSVISRKRLLFAVGKSSKTARNLKRMNCTIAFWMGSRQGSVVYIKGKASPLRISTHPVEGFETQPFILKIQNVLEDVSSKAKLTSTLTYYDLQVNMDHSTLSRDLNAISRRFARHSSLLRTAGERP